MLKIQFRFPELIITALHLRCVFTLRVFNVFKSKGPAGFTLSACSLMYNCTSPINHFGLDLITGSFGMSVCLTSGGSVLIIIKLLYLILSNLFGFQRYTQRNEKECVRGANLNGNT
jgi:hypothetical protein